MLPDIGATELLVIAIVALIFVGPKDLPLLLRRLGQFMAKVRAMAAEFRASFDDMARQSELDELRREVEAMRKGQLADLGGEPEMTHAVGEIEQSLAEVGVQLHPPMSHQFVEPEPPPPPQEPAPKKPRKPRAATAGKPARPRTKKSVEGGS